MISTAVTLRTGSEWGSATCHPPMPAKNSNTSKETNVSLSSSSSRARSFDAKASSSSSRACSCFDAKALPSSSSSSCACSSFDAKALLSSSSSCACSSFDAPPARRSAQIIIGFDSISALITTVLSWAVLEEVVVVFYPCAGCVCLSVCLSWRETDGGGGGELQREEQPASSSFVL